MSEQSPAPSKEMEEKRALIRAKIVQWWFMDRPCIEAIVDRAMDEVAAELGKEREAERSGGRVNSSAFWCDNRHVVDYEEAFNIERDLLAQNAQLKRELVEAREFLASAQRDANEWNRRWEDNQTKLVNLSSAYQRQKDALKKGAETFKRYAVMHLAKGTPEGERKAQSNLEMARLFEQALAETPDVSILDRVVEVLSMAANQIKAADSGVDIWYGETFTQTAARLDALLSTLQPDHQK